MPSKTRSWPSDFARSEFLDDAGRGVRRQRIGRKRVAVHAVGGDGGDNPIQIGIERLHIGELFRACGIIDLIKYLRPFLAHDVHILGVELREVVGVGQRYDVQRIGEAAHEVLLSGRFLGRIVHAGIDDEMLRLLVGPQCRGVLGPQGRILLPRLFDRTVECLRFRPVAARDERQHRKQRQQREYKVLFHSC